MLRRCTPTDFDEIYQVINDAALAYKNVIPGDCWHEPYMSRQELTLQMEEGVEFWCYQEHDKILGVMGIQDRREVTLIRHAYVRTVARNTGIGGKLLAHLRTLTSKPVLVGTWAAATWAIEFYQKHGFRLVSQELKNKLLNTYWAIPPRQVETSVVLVTLEWGSDG